MQSPPYYSETFGKYYRAGEARGEARAKALAILAFLEARGVAVSEAARRRIQGCDDLEELNGWIQQAAVVERADDLFDLVARVPAQVSSGT